MFTCCGSTQNSLLANHPVRNATPLFRKRRIFMIRQEIRISISPFWQWSVIFEVEKFSLENFPSENLSEIYKKNLKFFLQKNCIIFFFASKFTKKNVFLEEFFVLAKKFFWEKCVGVERIVFAFLLEYSSSGARSLLLVRRSFVPLEFFFYTFLSPKAVKGHHYPYDRLILEFV